MNDLATDYELAMLKGLKTKQGEIVKSKTLASALSNALNTENTITLEDGSEIPFTMGERLVIATVKDAIEKPSSDKLKNIMQMAGELKETKEIAISKVDEDLAKRALGSVDGKDK